MPVRQTRSKRNGLLASTIVPIAIATAACSPSESTGDSARPTGTSTAATSQESSPAPDSSSTTELRIVVGEDVLTATLDDSPASRDLLAQLPLRLEMTDLGSVEKIGHLPQPLSMDGQPDGADPVVGDLGYYEPWGNLVLYYGDQSYYDGIVRLGTLHGDVAAIGRYDDVTVSVERGN